MLQWPIRIASVVALTVLSYAWGDWFSSERPGLDGFLLALFTLVLLVALARLYRPGGLAAFDFDGNQRRAPGQVVSETAPAAVIAPRRESRREKAARRERADPAPLRPAPPAEAEAAPPRAQRRNSGSLWSSEHRASEATRGAGVDLNAAGTAELAPLPGLGTVWAQRIVRDREARGPFGSVDDLARLEGFNPAKLAALQGRLRVERSAE